MNEGLSDPFHCLRNLPNGCVLALGPYGLNVIFLLFRALFPRVIVFLSLSDRDSSQRLETRVLEVHDPLPATANEVFQIHIVEATTRMILSFPGKRLSCDLMADQSVGLVDRDDFFHLNWTWRSTLSFGITGGMMVALFSSVKLVPLVLKYILVFRFFTP